MKPGDAAPGRVPRVLFQVRRDASTNPGGDVVQLRRTMEELRAQGLAEVHFDTRPNLALGGYDLVHLFNLTRLHDTLLHAMNARRQGVPYVVSPIWHSLNDLGDFYRHRGGPAGLLVGTVGIVGYLAMKEVAYALRSTSLPPLSAVLRWLRRVRWVLQGASAVLPNSDAERLELEHDVGVTLPRTHIIRNATDLPTTPERGKRPPLVVCVGRIEPLKNQARVLEAFASCPELRDHELLFVGGVNPSHRSYAEALFRAMNGMRARWVGPVPREDVLATMARAEICVLASFFETTGLVGLEALAAGAKVVVTSRGYTREYFESYAEYCDPYSTASVRDALGRAHSTDVKLPTGFLERYSWVATAQRTAMAYRDVLASAPGAVAHG